MKTIISAAVVALSLIGINVVESDETEAPAAAEATADTAADVTPEVNSFDWIKDVAPKDSPKPADPSRRITYMPVEEETESIRFVNGVVWVHCSQSARSVVVCDEDGERMLRIDYGGKGQTPFVWEAK